MLLSDSGDHALARAAANRIEAADPDVAAAFRKAEAEGDRERLQAFVTDAETGRREQIWPDAARPVLSAPIPAE